MPTKPMTPVSIKLVDAKDSSLVYEVVWNAGIPDPAHFPKYKLTAAKDKDFTIQIRCYNAKHELLLLQGCGGGWGSKPQTSVVLMPDVRLLDLSLSPGTLAPVFHPNQAFLFGPGGGFHIVHHPDRHARGCGQCPEHRWKLSAWGLGNALTLDSGPTSSI